MTDTSYVFDVTKSDFDDAAVRNRLAKEGFVVLRGLFEPGLVADAAERVRKLSNSPAIAGVPGYSKVDHPKRIFNPFVIGGPLVDMVLDERVIDLIETHMGSECILAEGNVKIDEGVGYTYFDLHADFAAGWRKSKDSEIVLSDSDLKVPLAVGGAIYLHDTAEGAFSYCSGTHLMRAPRGPNITDYPKDERAEIVARKVRIDGNAGDMVLFDDRGFHGPDHPSRKQRTVVLLDYYRVETFGFTQVSPMSVWTNDLGRMSKKQMRVLGVGANYMVPISEYTGTRFRNNWLYPVIKFLIAHAYEVNHIKQKIKGVFRQGT